ncbi:MAG: 3-keto-disaccharide hydrolase [Chitinophagaceae bacterium]
MKIVSRLIVCFAVYILVAGFTKSFYQEGDWELLFNGRDMGGWDTYLGPPLDEKGKKLNDIPVGLNKDPNGVFSIATDGGQKVIRISGQEWGGISTAKEYENFHLQLKFKWGALSWGQKKGKKKDSGLLYFAVGEHGADYGAWMRSQEFQIQEGDCGDYWGVAGGMQDIKAIKNTENEYVYDPEGTLFTFGETSPVGRHCIKDPDAEKPSGQWNTIDLYCHRDTSIHVVNGKTVMVLYNSQQLENGQAIPLVKGKLQIQSEGAEVFYKEIRIRSIERIPAGRLK